MSVYINQKNLEVKKEGKLRLYLCWKDGICIRASLNFKSLDCNNSSILELATIHIASSSESYEVGIREIIGCIFQFRVDKLANCSKYSPHFAPTKEWSLLKASWKYTGRHALHIQTKFRMKNAVLKDHKQNKSRANRAKNGWECNWITIKRKSSSSKKL